MSHTVPIKSFDVKRLRIVENKSKGKFPGSNLKLKYIYDNDIVNDLALDIGEIGPITMFNKRDDKYKDKEGFLVYNIDFSNDKDKDLYMRIQHILFCAMKIITSDEELKYSLKSLNKQGMIRDWQDLNFDQFIKDKNAYRNYLGMKGDPNFRESDDDINKKTMFFDLIVNDKYHTKFVVKDDNGDNIELNNGRSNKPTPLQFIQRYSGASMNLIPVLKFNDFWVSTSMFTTRKVSIPMATVTKLEPPRSANIYQQQSTLELHTNPEYQKSRSEILSFFDNDDFDIVDNKSNVSPSKDVNDIINELKDRDAEFDRDNIVNNEDFSY